MKCDAIRGKIVAHGSFPGHILYCHNSKDPKNVPCMRSTLRAQGILGAKWGRGNPVGIRLLHSEEGRKEGRKDGRDGKGVQEELWIHCSLSLSSCGAGRKEEDPSSSSSSWACSRARTDQTPSSPLFIWLTCGACHEHLLHGLP